MGAQQRDQPTAVAGGMPSAAVRLHLIFTQTEARPVAARLEVVQAGTVCLRLLVDENGHVTVHLDASSEDGTAETSSGLQAPSGQPGSGTTEHASAAHSLERQHAALLQEHACLAGHVRQLLNRVTKGGRTRLQNLDGQLATEGAGQRYLPALQQLHRLLAEESSAAAAAKAVLEPARAQLAAAEARVQTQREALHALVSGIADASARAAKAGRAKAGVSAQALRHFQSAEPAAAARVVALHCTHACLSRQLASCRKRYKQADLLSTEGLHLVDYEQLRIENAGLAARCETRAAEVEKLRRKLGQAVQITAHLREKLHRASHERSALERRLAAAEAEAAGARASLGAARAARERAQRERSELAQDWRIVSDPLCLADMRRRAKELEGLQAEAAALQRQYAALGGA